MGNGGRQPEPPDGITVFFLNSNQTPNTTYTQINRSGAGCQHRTSLLSRDGGAFTFLVDGDRFKPHGGLPPHLLPRLPGDALGRGVQEEDVCWTSTCSAAGGGRGDQHVHFTMCLTLCLHDQMWLP
ncbi:unnamed protein product [Lota lota]